MQLESWGAHKCPTGWHQFAKSFKLIKGLYFLQFKNTPEFLQAEAEDLSLMTAGPKPSAAAAPPTSSSAGAAVPKRASQLASFGVPLVAAGVVSHARTLTVGITSTKKVDAMDVQQKDT